MVTKYKNCQRKEVLQGKDSSKEEGAKILVGEGSVTSKG